MKSVSRFIPDCTFADATSPFPIHLHQERKYLYVLRQLSCVRKTTRISRLCQHFTRRNEFCRHFSLKVNLEVNFVILKIDFCPDCFIIYIGISVLIVNYIDTQASSMWMFLFQIARSDLRINLKKLITYQPECLRCIAISNSSSHAPKFSNG